MYLTVHTGVLPEEIRELEPLMMERAHYGYRVKFATAGTTRGTGWIETEALAEVLFPAPAAGEGAR